MGKGIVEQLKGEFPVEDTWLPFEIHPETPPGGVPLASLFSPERLRATYADLRQRGAAMGITFGDVTHLSNSRLAMEAGECARDQGRFEQFHEVLFRAYFSETRDIGDRTVLRDLAGAAGLDAGEMDAALDDRRYLPRLEETTREARRLHISAAPTFLIAGGGRIVGVQPIAAFREALSKASRDAAGPPG